ncbi:uncharacterized protein PHACADRAFT_209681 [Phanerochaete carnosa HHB-10118-sp]|uniref:Alcohol acetyltransferase n=1 Tax=Phanerochaete carnosa (strain HHB-10118-sp) TaxID=650164 RepID=K5WAF6_PHACS|nr:uncharacterized protein PHACADRAFT_209681 [Phanerochaete carnosa HHB-10118-sp]EKM56200.1 hypothetical protein PHACADRAFT_209681 [Phanerochaete carnosa HHB-10118-sp]
MSFSAQDVVRKAGIMERYHILLSQIGFDSCVTVLGEYVSATGSSLTKETLYPALHTIIQKHGALGMQVLPGATIKAVPKFVRLHEIDLDVVVEFLQDDSASKDELLRSQLERPFALGTTAPLWRLTVVNGRVLVLAYHHSIADGQSGPAVHAALWSALNSVSAGEEGCGSKVAVPADSSMVGPVEAYTKISVSPSSFAQMLHALFAPKKLQAGSKAWTGNPVPKTPMLDITVRCWEITAGQTAEILKRCREHKTTLTPFLHILVAGVLSRLLVERKLTKKLKTIAAEAPVSLRRFTGVSPFELCDQVSLAHQFLRIAPIENDKPFPWDTVHKLGEDLHGSMRRTRELVGMLRILLRLGIADTYFTDMLGKKRGSGLVQSNLGRFPMGEAQKADDAKWRLEKVYFAQSAVVEGPAMKVNVIGSPEGSTNITFAWGKGAMDDDLAEAFIKEMKATLDIVLLQ